MGLTQEELAERAGLHAQEISKLERGVLRSPHSTTVEFLARALKLDPLQKEGFIVAARGQLQPSAVADQAIVRDGEPREGSGQADRATGRNRRLWPLDRRLFVPALLGLLVVPFLIGFGVWQRRAAASSIPPSLPRCMAAGYHGACWATITSAGSDQGGPCHGQVPLYLRGGTHMCLPGGDLVKVTCYYSGNPKVDGDAVQDHVEGEKSGQLKLLGHIPNRFVDLGGSSPSAVGLPTCLTLRIAAASTAVSGPSAAAAPVPPAPRSRAPAGSAGTAPAAALAPTRPWAH
jgi:transcriptional regulator with XRE-family HTH domain